MTFVKTRDFQLSFEQDEDSLVAIVREDNLNPTIIGMITIMAISSDPLVGIEFKGIMLAHIRRVVESQGGEITSTEIKE